MASWRARCAPSRNRSRIPLEVHFASDMQKSSLPPAFADLRLGSDTNLVFHSVADSKEPNWMVESVTAPAKIYDPKKVRVQAVIAGTGASEPAKRTVSLALDGKVLESKSVDVPRQRPRIRRSSCRSNRRTDSIRPRSASSRSDSLHQDDRFAFAIERADPHPVLFLHPAGEDRDELYYRSALESVPEAGFVLEPLAVEQAANQVALQIRFRRSFRRRRDARGPRKQLARLRRWRADRCCRARAVIGRAQRMFRSRMKPSKAPATRRKMATAFQTVATADAEHPALRRANKLDGVQFYQVISVDPGQSRVIARLTNQLPLLLEKQVGEGRVMVFTSTFDNISNDLPLHASFVPFVEETARYLGGQQDQSTNVAVDSYLELRSAKERGAAVEVLDPDGNASALAERRHHRAFPSKSTAKASTRFTAPTADRNWLRSTPTAANPT